MRATLNAARSKCGASVVPSSDKAMRRRSFALAIWLAFMAGLLARARAGLEDAPACACPAITSNFIYCFSSMFKNVSSNRGHWQKAGQVSDETLLFRSGQRGTLAIRLSRDGVS